jgi:tetratricopeptide (TPR) repeat protein
LPSKWISSANSSGLGRAYLTNGQLDKAETTYRKTLLLSPNRRATRAVLARVLVRKGDQDKIEDIWDLIEEEPFEPLRLIATASMHYRLGNTAEADTTLETLIEKYSGKTDALIALAYAIRGDADKTLEWLQQAVEIEGPQALLNTWYSSGLEILHGDPRWEKLLVSAGFSKQQLDAIDFEFTLPE